MKAGPGDLSSRHKRRITTIHHFINDSKKTFPIMSANKKETWKFIIQTAIAILTAIATSLGVTSCIAAI